MDRMIGFSTGALAFGDYERALRILAAFQINCVELSALRQSELSPLIRAIGEMDLTGLKYVSIHAPSTIAPGEEQDVIDELLAVADRGLPVIVHPDVIGDYAAWAYLGRALCVENMDKRKPIGRTGDELAGIFDRLPSARLCFDIGHARQVDSTMTEAYFIIQQFGDRLRQVHVSEVNTQNRHDPLSYAALLAFQPFGRLIAPEIPLIIEAVIDSARVPSEVELVREAFSNTPELSGRIFGATTEDLILLENTENICVRLAETGAAS